MNIPTGTPISLLPTGTIDNLQAVFPLSIGMPSSPATIQASLQQTAEFLMSNKFNGAYMPSGTQNFNIQFFLGNGLTVLPTGSVYAGYHYVEVPVACQIDSWQLAADVTGSVTINIYRSTNSGFPPASPLAGLGQPKLTNQRKTSGNPTGTVSLAAQDILLVEVTSSATIKIADLSLRARKV